MPTTTDILGAVPTNAGPVTTAFAPPTSCAENRNTWIAASFEESTSLLGVPTCGGPTRSDCYPSGSKIESAYNATTDRSILPYYSPGLECPSGWTTAGTTAAGGKAAGIFTTDMFPRNGQDSNFPQRVPYPAKFAFMLDPSETLVWCCPSGYDANTGGDCVSSMGPASSFPFTAMCGVYAPLETGDFTYTGPPAVTSFHGTTWKPPLQSDTPYTYTSQLAYYTSFRPIPTGDVKRLDNTSVEVFVAKAEPALALIHKKDDKKSEAVTMKGFQPSVFGIVSAMPVAAAIGSVLAGIFVL